MQRSLPRPRLASEGMRLLPARYEMSKISGLSLGATAQTVTIIIVNADNIGNVTFVYNYTYNITYNITVFGDANAQLVQAGKVAGW